MEKRVLARIISEEVLKVLSEQQPPRSVRLRRGMIVHKQLKNPGGVAASVKQLQTKLVKLGFAGKPFSIDGDYGNATMAAVKNFQQKNNLKPDGIAGKNTIATLVKAPKAQEKKPSQPAAKQQAQAPVKKAPQQAIKQQAPKPKQSKSTASMQDKFLERLCKDKALRAKVLNDQEKDKDFVRKQARAMLIMQSKMKCPDAWK